MLSKNAKKAFYIVRPFLSALETANTTRGCLTLPKPRQVMTMRNLQQAVQRISTDFVPIFPTKMYPESVPNISCRLATKADKDEIVDFLCHMFIVREPLMKVLKANIKEAKPFLEHHVESALRHNASFVATDEIGQICGIRLNAVGPADESEYECIFGPKMNTVNRFLSHVEHGIADRLQTTRFIRHIAICVKPEIVQCGVGTVLMTKSVEFARKHGLKYMMATCTGKIATKLATKMGFRVVRQVPYDSYSDPPSHFDFFPDDFLVNTDLKPFIGISKEHYSAKLMVRNVL